MANGLPTPFLHDTQTMMRLREFEFSQEDFEALRRLGKQLNRHSESLFKVSEQYALIGKTVYRRAG